MGEEKEDEHGLLVQILRESELETARYEILTTQIHSDRCKREDRGNCSVRGKGKESKKNARLLFRRKRSEKRGEGRGQ